MNEEILLKEIENKYGSLEMPNYEFTHKFLNSNPYSKVVDKLKESFIVEDDA